MKALKLIVMALCLSHFGHSQECNCADNYSWLKETFEQNDAGFQYVIDQKGESEYEKHCDTYSDKVKAITDKEECIDALFEWLRFFRNGHIWIGAANQDNSNGNKPDESKIKKQFKDWEKFNFKENEFESYVAKIKEPGLEGIWSSPPYKIGIKKAGDEHIGFIIEADGVYWSRSQVKLRIRKDNGSLSATYYMRDHSVEEFSDVEMLGSNYLKLGFMTFKRVDPAFPTDPTLERHFRVLLAEEPIFESISGTTALLRIPSFEHSEKKLIDSVISANLETITQTENLIIDLRYNGGGSDGSFQEILPLIYTNPIRTVGVEYLSTELNNQRMAEMANDQDWSEEDRNWAEERLQVLNSHIGEFVNLNESVVGTDTFDTIFPNPKNVGIIINNGCGSTTEQFLLAAKQSSKVKLFGTTTRGNLDISNMYSVYSPCEDLELAYCLSRSMRIPDMTIDDKGIQPDHFIDKSVPEYDWIEFVNLTLNRETFKGQ